MTAANSSKATLLPGLADPVLDAQRVFRALLDAMARPGTTVDLPGGFVVPVPVSLAAGAMLLSLADHDTPLWLDCAGQSDVTGWLGFHCGCPLVEDPSEASFALVTNPSAMPPLAEFQLGTEEYPDRSTTIILQVPSLSGDEVLTLAGPGIKDRVSFAPAGLPRGFKDWIVQNNALFPRGVDLVFASGNQMAALSRSTRVGI